MVIIHDFLLVFDCNYIRDITAYFRNVQFVTCPNHAH